MHPGDIGVDDTPLGRRIWRFVQDMSPFVWIGVAFTILGSLFLVLVLASPGGLLFTGTAVRGTEQGGIVYYSYKGSQYTIEDLGLDTSQPRYEKVYLDLANPSDAMLDNGLSRYSDVGFFGGPYGLAFGFFAAGLVRRRRLAHADETLRVESFGRGIDHDTYVRVRAQQQADARRRRAWPSA